MRSSRCGRAFDAALVAALRLDPDDEDVLPGEAAVLRVERLQAAYEESGAEKKQQAERHLRHDEDLPRSEPMTAANRPARLSLEARDDIDSGRAQGRNETAQDSR